MNTNNLGFTYYISGETSIEIEQPNKPRESLSKMLNEQNNSSTDQDSNLIYTEKDFLKALNRESELVCELLEKELRKKLPPGYNVVADVQFSSGSIAMTGTVMVLSWLGNVALQAAKEELEEKIGSVVKITIQRVFSRIQEVMLVTTLEPMDVSVIPVKSDQPMATVSSTTNEGIKSFQPMKDLGAAIGFQSNWSMYQIILVFLLFCIIIISVIFLTAFLVS